MIRLFTIVIILLSASAKNCTKKSNIVSGKYEFGVSFGSKCCGTSSSDFLKEFLTTFYKENKSSLNADIVQGCGREGEFIILIKIPGEDALLKDKFEKKLVAMIEQENQKNYAANNSSGYITLVRELMEKDYDFCRIPVATWLK